MFLSLLSILLVLIIAYIWASRGFFSALVHMVCVIVAGAIAFAVWEPVAYFMLDRFEATQWILDVTWGVALAVPFAVVLAALRLGVDSILGANTELDGATNLVGGGLCGAVSGVITVGILVISLTFMRGSNEVAPVIGSGYQPVAFDTATGSLTRQGGLIFPVDRITGALYGYTSERAFAVGTPLAVWRPAVAEEGALLRMNFNKGTSRNVLPPDAFEFLGAYTVGEGQNIPTQQLTRFVYDGNESSQTVRDLDGEAIQNNHYILGYIVNFLPGAREKAGQVIMGNAQMRLVVRDPSGRSRAIHPFAMVSQASGDSARLGRWPLNRPETFIASVGGGSDSPMAFEFLVPNGSTPLALYVRGVRVDLRPGYGPAAAQNPQRLQNVAARDGAVRSGSLLASAGAGGGELDRSNAMTLQFVLGQDFPLQLTSRLTLAGRSVLSKDNLDGLEIDERNRVINGTGRFRNNQLAQVGLAQQLMVTEIASTDDTSIVQVSLTATGPIGRRALTIDPSQMPILVDNNGLRYVPIGYTYMDGQETHIRVTPGRPIRAVSDLPNGGPTASRPDQQFWLVYRVSRGVEITDFAIGNTVVARFVPPIEVRR